MAAATRDVAWGWTCAHAPLALRLEEMGFCEHAARRASLRVGVPVSADQEAARLSEAIGWLTSEPEGVDSPLALPSEVEPCEAAEPGAPAAPIAERNRSAPGAGLLNDPATLRALYAVDDALGGAAPANRQAVTAFLGQTYSAAAEASFFESLFPAGAATPIALVGDATTGATPGIEAMLDAEYMPAMGALNPTEFWGFAGRSPVDAMDEPFLAWLYAVGNASDAAVPLVFSTSYGEDEASELPSGYAERVSAERANAKALRQALQKTQITIGDDEEYC